MHKKHKIVNLRFCLFTILLVVFSVGVFPVNASTSKNNKNGNTNTLFDEYIINSWQQIEKGLDFIRVVETIMVEEEENTLPKTLSFDVLRFSPQYFQFSAYGVDIDNTYKRSLYGWLRDFGLVAVINASMYLPDEKTSIGYLKKNDKFSNARIGKKLGAFFVSEPKKKFEGKIPNTALLYANETDFNRFKTGEKELSVQDVLDKYSVVIQNFRLLELEGDNLTLKTWKGQRRHSIASLAEDSSGNILLMYASNPLTINEFIKVIQKNTVLKIEKAMYLEGGTEAGMLYSGVNTFSWQLNDSLKLFLKGVILLPNIIGIQKR